MLFRLAFVLGRSTAPTSSQRASVPTPAGLGRHTVSNAECAGPLSLYRPSGAQVPLADPDGRVQICGLASSPPETKCGKAVFHLQFNRVVTGARGLLLLPLLLAPAGCWRIGEPTESAALVTWAAYPDTVVAGSVFSFEFAGPVSPDACGRLDTVIVAIEDESVVLSARRSVYDTMCASGPVSFYEARPVRIPRSGIWSVRTAEGRNLGAIVVTDSGSFSPMRAIGDGTLHAAGGCLLFGPGWIGNQRPFALRGAPEGLEGQAGTDRRIFVDGRLEGFTLCGAFGSRPVIRVNRATVTDSTGAQYYTGEDDD
jgi:hypothetical protein